MLVVEKISSLLGGARYISSPNFDARPEGTNIDTLVIHAISLPLGEYGGTDIEVDGQEVKILRESDILAKIVK